MASEAGTEAWLNSGMVIQKDIVVTETLEDGMFQGFDVEKNWSQAVMGSMKRTRGRAQSYTTVTILLTRASSSIG